MIRLNKKRAPEDIPLSTLEYNNIRAAVDRLDQAVLKWHRGAWRVISRLARNSNVGGSCHEIEITGAQVGNALLVTVSRDDHSVTLLGSQLRSEKDWTPRHPCGIHAINASPNEAGEMLEEAAKWILGHPECLYPRNDLVVSAVPQT